MIIKKESVSSEVQVKHTTELQGKPRLQEECSQLQCSDKNHSLWSVRSITSSSPHWEKAFLLTFHSLTEN